MQSERRILFPKKEDVRRKSTNTFGHQHSNDLFSDMNRFDSFGKSKNIEVPKDEPVDWQNQSFGDSEDNKIFESKRILDVNIEGSESDNEGQNFSFCESENKTQPRNSGINNIDSSNKNNYETGYSADINLFSDTNVTDKFNIEQMLKRPTAVIVPSYVDTGMLTSDCKIFTN